jgi:hypothetical protein
MGYIINILINQQNSLTQLDINIHDVSILDCMISHPISKLKTIHLNLYHGDMINKGNGINNNIADINAYIS